ncbi:MAG: endonuclease/exonuclease/phosphatase family protein [Gammaproteobacteria bacterium]|jgi:endonuclease/exonuclease/phosphatase family metal-dependent hydrolase|nr:endonuclease/exonuclease/phosphatase family protein [Gammaproteobacteria bacterium]
MHNKILLTLFILNVVVLTACATVDKQQRTVYSTGNEPDHSISIQQCYPDSALRVATLNMAHGRKNSVNQLFVRKNTFKQNLDDIAGVLTRYRPHIVALQEADNASRWSGNFDHVAYLATAADYPWLTHVSNAEGWLYSYGTALLSALPPVETIKHTFEPSPPTLNKGFVLAEIEWPCSDDNKSRKVDVISVHLDFSRESVRERQIHEMLEILSARMKPTIIMGDFNSEWLAEASVIKELATKSRFVSYEPETGRHQSYKNKRLDWILITKDMEFTNYQVLPDSLSDHAMVLADIRFKQC